MAASERDNEALREIHARSFSGAKVVEISCEMRSRRLILRLYGPGLGGTHLTTLTFYNATALELQNDVLAFPESIALETLTVVYDDGADRGTINLTGTAGWALGWSFDGVAFEQQPLIMTSLEDELASEVV